jgi:hypothetical protein
MHELIVGMKAEADRKLGEYMERLNACGPKGNRSVESAIDYWRGRSDALGAVLALLVDA